jgi:para-aminobenzoate synthetase component I
MRHLEFDCSPSIPRLLDRLAGRPGRFVLENVPAGTAIVGADPVSTLTAEDGDPFAALRDQLAAFRSDDAATDLPFAGGAVGYFSYDLGRSIEQIEPLATEDIPTPDFALGFYDSALCIDAANRKCTAVSRSGDLAALEFWRDLALDSTTDPAPAPVTCSDDLRCCFTKQEYLSAVGRVRDYIRAGDVYQVNIAQRFETDISCSPAELYAAVRRANPATNGCFIELDGGPTLVCASPESFLRYDPRTRRIITKPIKGTRPRGRTREEDSRLAAELAASEKDRAENLMIVDMLRNDLGRVAQYGSVQVTKLWDIEPHPTVLQMVSTIEGVMGKSYDAVDLIKASFPGGSITGAPKIRAMQIIEELEPFRRGLYCGSAGFIDCRGHIDLNIVIRSFIVHGSRAYLHGGGGIVIDSDPELEYQETLDKIAGLKAALEGE